jgi:hypothetical protein
MKSTRGLLLCQGSCAWYWDGNHWHGPYNHCSPGCTCSKNPPSNPPPGTPAFYQFEQCVPSIKAGTLAVEIHYTPDQAVRLIPVPKKRRKRGK